MAPQEGRCRTEDIPAVTQLFTPPGSWRYPGGNSAWGRLWLLNVQPLKPARSTCLLHRGRNPRPTFRCKNAPSPRKSPASITAVGSGHNAHSTPSDLLSLIYAEEGYAPKRDSGPDPAAQPLRARDLARAAQLAELGRLVFKAAESCAALLPERAAGRPADSFELQNGCSLKGTN